MLDTLTRRYELSEPQRQNLRPHLEKLRQEADAYNQQHAAELDALQEKWRQARQQIREGRIEPAEIRQQMMDQREQWLRYREAGPLSSASMETALLKVMSPQEYNAKCQANRQRDIDRAMPWLTRVYDLSEEQGQQVRQMLERRLRGDGRWWFQVRELSEALEGMLPADQVAQAHQRQDQRLRRSTDQRPPRGTAPRQGPQTPTPPAASPAELVPVRSLGPWEQYVQRFSEHYQLLPDQRAQADAILNDCLQRADAYRLSRRGELAWLEAALAETTDHDRQAELAAEKAALQSPIDEIYEELKARLQNILTSEQLRRGDLPN